MWIRLGLTLLLLISGWAFSSPPASASCEVQTSPRTYADGEFVGADTCDPYAASKPTWNSKLQAGEDQAATGGGSASGVTVVESRYLSSGTKAADAQIKASAGYVQKLLCIGTDAAATVGTIKLFDSLTETGTEVWSWTTVAVALNTQFLVIPIEAAFATGIYLGYTTLSDVQCTVFYR